MTNKPHRCCRNCGSILPENAVFCPACSQKTLDGRVSIRTILKDFFDHIFALDSRIVNTITALAIPGKLTYDYFNGVQAKYYHPFRLFFFVVAALIALITLRLGDMNLGKNLVEEKIAGHQLHEDFLKLDSLSRNIAARHQSREVNQALDTLMKKFTGGKDLKSLDSITLYKLSHRRDTMLFPIISVNVGLDDYLKLSSTQLADKYQVKGFFSRLIFMQSAKITKQQKDLLLYIIGNSLWMMFLMMPAFALILKMLYIRSGFYFVEHLIFSFNSHTFQFSCFALLLLIGGYLSSFFIFLILTGMVYYIYKSMRRYYGQNRKKTFLKFTLACFGYFFILSIAIFLTILISFAAY